jgi:hypothetical protein
MQLSSQKNQQPAQLKKLLGKQAAPEIQRMQHQGRTNFHFHAHRTTACATLQSTHMPHGSDKWQVLSKPSLKKQSTILRALP